MARRPTQQDRIEALLAKYNPIIRAAFTAAIRDISDRAQVGRIAALLERGDTAGALRALHIDAAAYQEFDEALREAYIAGGTSTVGSLPLLRDPDGGRVVIRFDARNLRAERWLAEHSSRSITRIVDDQRAAIREALTEGMAQGRNPRSVALDIVGRVDPAAGRRVGGIIGLSRPQERYVAAARAELLSGDPTQMRAYLGRLRRDARFDGQVLRAIKDEKPVAAETVSRMVGRYADRLLELRGETIGRTESLGSLHAAQDEAYTQAVETGAVRRQDVRKFWLPPPKDKRARDNHQAMRGETIGLGERYSNGLRYPCDPEGDVSETANCRCREVIRIDFLSNLE